VAPLSPYTHQPTRRESMMLVSCSQDRTLQAGGLSTVTCCPLLVRGVCLGLEGAASVIRTLRSGSSFTGCSDRVSMGPPPAHCSDQARPGLGDRPPGQPSGSRQTSSSRRRLWVVWMSRCAAARGWPAVMLAQLDRLVSRWPACLSTIQVIPFSAAAVTCAAAGCLVHLLLFADPELPDIVYIEQLTQRGCT